MNVEFRSYRPSDATILPELFMRALRSVYPDAEFGTWTDDLSDIEATYLRGGDVIVGIEGDRIVAMGAIKPVDASTVEMKRVAVDPNHHGQGLGQALLGAIEARARALGFKRMILDTTSKQVAARRLYDKNGYRQIDRRMVDHASGNRFDIFFYEKTLD